MAADNKFNTGIEVTERRKGFDDLLENLADLYNPNELDQIKLAYEQMRSLESGRLKARLVRSIIPIEEWVNSSYYIGPDTDNIYPYWKERLIDMFSRSTEERINQVILTGAIGCLKTDTLYATSEGFKTVKQLSDDFSVLSEDDIEKATATKAHVLGVKPTKIITLSNGTELEGTHNHKVKVLSDNKIVWKRFDMLKNDDIMVLHRKKELFGSIDYDEDLAYMIGYILGDGYCTVNHNKHFDSQLVSISLQSNQSNYDRVQTLFTNYFGKPCVSIGNNKTVNLRKISGGFSDFAFWNAINNRSHDKYIPDYMLELNESAVAALLRGLFDTDGSASNKSCNVEFSNTSKTLIYQMKRLLAAFGINSKVSERTSTYTPEKSFKSFRLIIQGIEDLTNFHKYIGFELDYKQAILEGIISRDNSNQRIALPGVLEVMRSHDKVVKATRSRIHRHATGILSNQNRSVTERTFNWYKENLYEWLILDETLKYIANNNVYTVVIKSIKDSEAEVGDIEVPTTHCYNLGGIISHNTGKSTFAVLAIIRTIYELSCYEHISSLFNLFGVSRIAFAYLSVTRTQAQSTGFALMVEWLDSISYFREMFQRKAGIDTMVIWPQERLLITFGSVANHFIGMNLIGSILDEANFFSGRSREESDFKMNTKVAELYTQIVTRSESRFIVNGVNHSLSILVSSSTVESSFTEDQRKKSKGDIHTLVASPSIWEVKPQNYCGTRFYVYTGGDSVDPFVVKEVQDFNMLLKNKKLPLIKTNISAKSAYSLLPASIQANLIAVPIEHKKAFDGDIIIALQDLAGYSVSSANKLFTSKDAYKKAIHTELAHPFSRTQITLSTTKEPLQEGFLPLKSYLNTDIMFPKKHMPRFVHLDLALTGDSAGIAMCYIAGWKTIYKQDIPEGELIDVDGNYEVEDEIKIPILAYDFMLRIDPPKKPNKIALSKIRDFLVYLRQVRGVKFGLITADQFQSAQLLQELDELDFNTAGLSVDRTADAYLTFTNLLYEERVNLYDYSPFKQEIFNVIYYPAKKKVDHPVRGSKDVADAVVGSAWSALKSADKTDVDEQSLLDLFTHANKGQGMTDYESAVADHLETILKQLKNGR